MGRRPDGAWTAPLALARAPGRLAGVRGLRATWATGPLDPVRLATAARQDLWRRLAAARSLVPAVIVAQGADAVSLLALAATLDHGRAASMTLDAVREIFHDAAVRQWSRWAAAT